MSLTDHFPALLHPRRGFPSPYLGMSLTDLQKWYGRVREFPSPYLGMSLPDIFGWDELYPRRSVSVPMPGDVPSGQFQNEYWIRDLVSIPIPGDVPNRLYTLYHTEKYINCKQKIQNPLPAGKISTDFGGGSECCKPTVGLILSILVVIVAYLNKVNCIVIGVLAFGISYYTRFPAILKAVYFY